ncbi:PREDICTED: trihelix transcription factor GTL1 isoform X1 [Tarenaya hassleriana]|uniref:trihelix transcription factor GTL1 isoform X2 n=1 Tax=Tarenaya hassleriana TaxID=28532 RepID=UPI00053C54B9|nr:PREDICTED: trihelix transcription factor GTL1 isoform X2 [Tarenaya hassleriana]XP_010543480.1 PREDICTED: trihelix transcription factor GTL1 isoform X1 [Tarenaya hassleriana]
MESNGLSSVMFSGFSPGMLSLEMPQNPQNPQNPIQFQHPQMVSYAGNNGGGGDQQHHNHHQTQPPMKTPQYPYASKHKQLSPLSDEDDPGSGSVSGYNPEDSTGADGKRKFSPWQRMKWTDTIFFGGGIFLGDEAGSSETADAAKKKPSSSAASTSSGGGGLLQKKGKWKSVSRAMMEKGFYVSPQQCEDKFNDLNKRYKRVNDILGKGTACRVVENQSLLESMDLPPKLKEEAKKLLNSKHLFFREMCAYHNSCGHLTHTNANAIAAADQPQTQTQSHPQPQQSCFHSAAAGDSSKMTRIAENGEEEEEESDTAEDSDTEDDSDEEGEEEEVVAGKRQRKMSETGAVRGLMEEVGRVAMDMAKGAREKKEWMKKKMVELEERRVGFEWEALEMEKQSLKWMRFKSKKEREMEKARLDNQRRRLENERMLLLLRRKEMEFDTSASASASVV